MTAKTDLRHDPARTANARANACRAIRSRAVAAYAHLLPEILSLRSGGSTLGQIADHLNAAGHKTRNSARFDAKTVSRILTRADRASG